MTDNDGRRLSVPVPAALVRLMYEGQEGQLRDELQQIERDASNEPGPNFERNCWCHALKGLIDYLRARGHADDRIAYLQRLLLALMDLDRGVVSPNLRPVSHGSGADTAIEWEARAFLAAAVEGKKRNGVAAKAAARWVAQQVPEAEKFASHTTSRERGLTAVATSLYKLRRQFVTALNNGETFGPRDLTHMIVYKAVLQKWGSGVPSQEEIGWLLDQATTRLRAADRANA